MRRAPAGRVIVAHSKGGLVAKHLLVSGTDVAPAGTRGLLGLVAITTPFAGSRLARLLIDPNRGRDDPTLVMRLSDGAVIPGNRKLDAAEREKRLGLYYEPYHRTIDRVIDRCLATGRPPALLAIHSFTESWKQFTRPWHVGVLWGADARLAGALEAWAHDAFFDYADRWMDPAGDAEYTQAIFDRAGLDFRASWAAHGQAWDAFVEEMWAAYR